MKAAADILDFGKINCAICGAEVHIMASHLVEHGVTVEEYERDYPGHPTLSRAAKIRLGLIQDQAINAPKIYDVKKTFGVKFDSDALSEVDGFEKPHKTTPPADADYKFRDNVLAVILYALKNEQEKVLFTGPTGSGKTSGIVEVCARLNLPMYRVNMDSDITRADFVGLWVLKGKDMAFQYGILPMAMRDGAVLIVDEWDCIHPSVGMVLQAALEGKPLTITETGETIHPAPGFRIFATANTIGQGDDTGLYNGTTMQNFATLDRFTVVEIVDYPTKAEEKDILIKKTGIACTDTLAKLLEYAKLIRDAFKKGEVRCTLSTRTIVNIAAKIRDFGDVKRAYELAYVNKLIGSDRDFALEILQRVWAISLN